MRRASCLAAFVATCFAVIAGAYGQAAIDIQLRTADGARMITGVEATAQTIAFDDIRRIEPPLSQALARSDSDGRIVVDVAALARRLPLDQAARLVLRFSAGGFEARAVHLPLPVLPSSLVVELAAPLDAAALDEATTRALQGVVAADPNVLLVLAPAAGADPGGASFALGELARAAQRRVSAYALTVAPPPLRLRVVDPALLADRGAALLATASDAARALGAVHTRAEAAVLRNRPATRFISTFAFARAGNAATRWHVVEELIDDATRREAPALLPEPVVATWARFAVLAFAQRELAQARLPGDLARVRLVQQLLAQELRQSGAGNSAFISELRAVARAATAMTQRSSGR